MALADDPTGAQQSHNLQLTLQPQPPVAPQPVVVDRVQYLNEQRQFQEQQRQAAIQQYEQQQQLLARYAPLFNLQQQTAGRVQYLNEQRQFQDQQRQAAIQQYEQQQQLLARYAPLFNLQQQTAGRVQELAAIEQQRQAQEDDGGGFLGWAQDQYNRIPQRARAALPLVGPAEQLRTNIPGTDISGYDILRTDVPGMGKVAETLGRSAQAAASIPAPTDILPGLPDTRPFREAAAREAVEALVPREVWDTALTIIPAAKAKTVGELVAALTIGDVDAVRAFKSAAAKAGVNAEPVLRQLASERGFLRLGARAEPQRIGSQLLSSYDVIGKARSDSDRGTFAAFQVGDHIVDVAAPAARPVLNVSFLRQGTTTRGRVPGGAIQDLVQVGYFLEDLHRANPNKQIVAAAADQRLFDSYRRLAFEPDPSLGLGEFGVRLNTERLVALMRRARRFEGERGALQFARAAEDVGGGPTSRTLTTIPDTVVEKLAARKRAPTQATWDLLPEEDRQLITALAESVPTSAERKMALKAQHSRQAAGARQAFTSDEGTTVERAQQAFKGMAGKQEQRFAPVFSRFDGPQIDSYFSRIDEAVASGRIGAAFEGPRATSALHLLFYGTRLPGIESEAKLPLNLMPKEIDLLGRIFGPEFEAVLPRTAEELSLFQLGIDVLNAPRSLITAIDFSAAGRQGIILAPRNAKEWASSWKPMIEAMGSEEGFQRVAADLRTSPYWDDGLFHGLDITDIGGGSTAEEFFINALTQRLPGVQMSQRGFTIFLDYLRLKTYEKYASRLERTAEKWRWTPERLADAKRDMAAFLNHATGRGDLSGVSSFIPAMNAAFFSPRYLASRAQTVWDLVRPGVDPAVRQIAAENLGAFVGTGTLALGTLAATGAAAVEMDPRSSDFGKIRIGDQRIEFWGGFQPIARFIAQTAMGERKELFTGDFAKTYRGESVMRFIRSKLSPGGSLLYDLLANKGRTFEGDKRFFVDPKPATAWAEFQRNIFPLWVQDAIEGYRAQSLGAGVTAGAVSALGGGVGTFEATGGQQKEIIKSGVQKKLDEGGYPDFSSDFSANEKMREAVGQWFGVDAKTARGIDSWEAMRDYIVERDTARVAEALDVSETVAAQMIRQKIDANTNLKAVQDNARKAQLDWLRQHPDIAKEMADAGMLGALSKDEREILGID